MAKPAFGKSLSLREMPSRVPSSTSPSEEETRKTLLKYTWPPTKMCDEDRSPNFSQMRPSLPFTRASSLTETSKEQLAVETMKEKPVKRVTKVWTPPPKVPSDKLPSYFRLIALQQTPSQRSIFFAPPGPTTGQFSSPVTSKSTSPGTSPESSQSPTVGPTLTPKNKRAWPLLPVISPTLSANLSNQSSDLRVANQANKQPPITNLSLTKPPVKKLKERWPPVRKPQELQASKEFHESKDKKTPSLPLSNLIVPVKQRRSTFERGLVKHRPAKQSFGFGNGAEVGFHSPTVVKESLHRISRPVTHVKDRRQTSEPLESGRELTSTDTSSLEVTSPDENRGQKPGECTEKGQQDDPTRAESPTGSRSPKLNPQTNAGDDFRFYEFTLPSGQKLPKGSAQKYVKRRTRDRRTNYCITYDGPTLLTMRDHYGLFATVPEADDRFNTERPQDSLPMAPRHLLSPEFNASRKKLSQLRNNDLPPTLPRCNLDDDDDDSMELDDDEDHSFNDKDDDKDEEPHRSNEPHGIRGCNRPDVWITPIAGANPSERKWKVKRVWNAEEADDKEEEHTVDNEDLFGKVKDLLGVPSSDVNDEDMKAPWKIRKVIDVDGEVEESESESSLEESDMLHHFQNMATDCQEEFLDEDDAEDDEVNDEDYEFSGSSISNTDKHKERAFNRPDHFVSPMNASIVKADSKRTWKVKREWTVDDLEEKTDEESSATRKKETNDDSTDDTNMKEEDAIIERDNVCDCNSLEASRGTQGDMISNEPNSSKWLSGMTGNQMYDVPSKGALQKPSLEDSTIASKVEDSFEVNKEEGISCDKRRVSIRQTTVQRPQPEPKKKPIKLWWEE